MHSKLCSTCVYQVQKTLSINDNFSFDATKRVTFCLLTTTKHKQPCKTHLLGTNLYISNTNLIDIQIIIKPEQLYVI